VTLRDVQKKGKKRRKKSVSRGKRIAQPLQKRSRGVKRGKTLDVGTYMGKFAGTRAGESRHGTINANPKPGSDHGRAIERDHGGEIVQKKGVEMRIHKTKKKGG